MKTTNMKTLNSMVIATFLLGITLSSCSKNEGCTDPAANNFDIEATKDDGSCTYDALLEEEAAESHITFNFTHNFDGLPVTAGNFNQFNYVTANGDTINITKLRYLVSHMRLYTIGGDSVMLNDVPYQLVDLNNGTGLSFTAGESDFGAFAGVGFSFGFDTTDNSGNYVDLNSASWNVPPMMGGGYHNMQLEGKYKFNGNDSSYAYHNIAKKRVTMVSPFEANNISIRLGGIALNQHNVVVEIQMNIAEWFKNPTTWDLNTYHSSLMENYTAQSMMQANGYNVFSLGAVYQKH